MEDIDLQAGLKRLSQSLRQMKALLAWGQLKQSEAQPDQPPSFQIYDPTETDLRNEYSLFLSTSIQIRNALREHRASISEPAREMLRKKLAMLEQEAHQLNVCRRWPGY